VEIALRDGQHRLGAKKEELDDQYAQDVQRIDDEVDAKIHWLQASYKMWAVLLPPVLPLLLAGIVFFSRRAKEREGVSKNRMV